MNRENEILRIIRANPLISQDEIAEKLQIKRSTVGVHILNLQKKGLILGRGYIFSEDNYVCGVGSVNVDIYCKSTVDLRMNYDHPSKIMTNIGGVTHNIIENLANLGINTKLISAIGDDVYATSITHECEKANIDTSHFLKLKETTSGVFMQVLDKNNDMALAMTNFDAISQMTKEFIESKSSIISNAKCVVCDPALPDEVMDVLLDMGVNVFCDPTSEALAEKIKDKVGKFYFLKPNSKELAILCGREIETEDDIYIGCKLLLNKGLKKICVSLGSNGCLFMDNDFNIIRKCFKPDETMANASGAGDAFMAAMIYGYINHLELDKTLEYASAAGIAAIRSYSTINENLSVSLIEEIIEEKKK